MDRPGGREIDSLNGWWHTWLDDAVDWESEIPLLPGTPTEAFPVRAPSVGWERVERGMESTRVPGTLAQARAGFHGVGWQWRPVVIPESWAQRRVILAFGGARQRVEVFLDGRPVGYDLDGLTPFDVDLTPHAPPGAQQELAVRLTNPGGWRPADEAGPLHWGRLVLPGSCDLCGMWGGVALMTRPTLHIADLFAMGDGISGEITVRVALRNAGAEAVAEVQATVRDGEGDAVAQGTQAAVAVPAGEEVIVALPLRIAAPRAWSPRRPYLYRLVAAVRSGYGGDRLETTLGLRQVEERDGLILVNGRPLGSTWDRVGRCGDEAALLPALADAERQVAEALAAGLDGLLSSGWPMTPAVLDAADRMGLPVVQTLVGVEDPAVVPEDARAVYETLARDRLSRLIRRDRHHPSVVAWRLPMPPSAAALDVYARLARETDPTRPVVALEGLCPGAATGSR